ncbi:MAG: hypothetical protein JJ964_02300 [Rhizobiales bacterium]|nr:hypothetical protein [Hyphomicrobiales bacterium]
MSHYKIWCFWSFFSIGASDAHDTSALFSLTAILPLRRQAYEVRRNAPGYTGASPCPSAFFALQLPTRNRIKAELLHRDNGYEIRCLFCFLPLIAIVALQNTFNASVLVFYLYGTIHRGFLGA